MTNWRSGGCRVDQNQEEIVEALRRVGASVVSTSSLGRGVPDLIVGFRGENYMIEVKNPKSAYGKSGLSKSQAKWRSKWLGAVHVVTSVDEALAAIGAIKAA